MADKHGDATKTLAIDDIILPTWDAKLVVDMSSPKYSLTRIFSEQRTPLRNWHGLEKRRKGYSLTIAIVSTPGYSMIAETFCALLSRYPGWRRNPRPCHMHSSSILSSFHIKNLEQASSRLSEAIAPLLIVRWLINWNPT